MKSILLTSVLYLVLHVQHIHTADKLYVTVISERSGIGDDDKTKVRCPDGYLLVGCKILQGSYVDGLQVLRDETEYCVAKNGYKGDGVIVSYTVYLNSRLNTFQ